jgi:hypothetical protein
MKHSPGLLGLSITSQQYFSLRTNQQLASSTFLSEQTNPSHQPNEQVDCRYKASYTHHILT